MDFPCVIPIEPITLTRQRMIEPRMMELELAQTWFSYHFKFRAEEPQKDDDDLPWEEVDNDYHGIFPKDKFAGIEKHWLQDSKRWTIVISIEGAIRDLTVYFKRQKDCEAVFDQLVEYFYAKKENL